jgi:catechol 2,3-dioxygenase-like lactoylglutathione lyase family enzyme
MTDTTAALNATNLGCSVTCKDLEASVRFFRDAVGFAVAQTYENEGKVVAAGEALLSEPTDRRERPSK